MSASEFDYLFHKIVGYLLLFFETACLDNVHRRCSLMDLDVRLSEQETPAMLIMFMDAAIGWVLDVSLSEQQTFAIYVDNVHGRCSQVGP
jgi:hypothetical protein